MRVFITGASGFIGSAVVAELLDKGHQVLGLARSDAAADAITRMGAEVQRGDLADGDSLADGVREAEGVIHLGFAHDMGDFAAAAELDRHAIAALGKALAGSGKAFVGTSGTMLLASGRVGLETDQGDPGSAAAFRIASEQAALALADRGVRACIVRPAPSVHGDGDAHGFVPTLVRLARAKGVSAYVGDGSNRWPAVHRLDAARLFRLALERGVTGARYHAVADEAIAFQDIATAIGRGVGLPVASIEPDKAAKHFGAFAFVVEADNPASNALTRRRLDWEPQEASLLGDLQGQIYFC